MTLEVDRAKVVKKISKLLALARSPNEHEAKRAAEEAERLMDKHGLSLMDVGNDAANEIVLYYLDRELGFASVAHGVAETRRIKAYVAEGIEGVSDGVRLRGMQAAVDDAANCYRSILLHCAKGFVEYESALEREWFRFAFVETVTKRLMEMADDLDEPAAEPERVHVVAPSAPSAPSPSSASIPSSSEGEPLPPSSVPAPDVVEAPPERPKREVAVKRPKIMPFDDRSLHQARVAAESGARFGSTCSIPKWKPPRPKTKRKKPPKVGGLLAR